MIFQLTASQGGWPLTPVLVTPIPQFQLTASQGGWRSYPSYSGCTCWYFNSQPHKEADLRFWKLFATFIISTHSLTRRLTNWWTEYSNWWFISTHSLTRRLTKMLERGMNILRFQLTASQGGWPAAFDYYAMLNNFNSQPHKEADKTAKTILVHGLNFNSQPHKEADPCEHLFLSATGISTHSLTRRLTPASNTVCACAMISTHSLTRRLTDGDVIDFLYPAFQLTASQGGWRPLSEVRRL